jgi:hypothetical protein
MFCLFPNGSLQDLEDIEVPSGIIVWMRFLLPFSADEHHQATERHATPRTSSKWSGHPTARLHTKTSRLSIFDYSDYTNDFTDIRRTHVRDVRGTCPSPTTIDDEKKSSSDAMNTASIFRNLC